MRMRRVVVAVIVCLALAAGVSTFLGADSPYDRNVDIERYPEPPERPFATTERQVTDYAIEYEQRRLYNDLLASRGHSLDTNDEVITRCSERSVTEVNASAYRLELACTGGIDDTKRLFQPGTFTYEVTYRVTENETTEVDVQDYPLSRGDHVQTAR